MALILPNTIANDLPADGDKLNQNLQSIVTWGNQDVISRDGSTAMTGPLLLPGAPTQPNQAATKAYADAVIPIGALWLWGGVAAPTNYLLCQGQAISRATYSVLYSVLSTRFGIGDNVTTFNLPDFRGRLPIGYYSGNDYAQTLGLKGGNADATVPSHLHTIAHTHTFSDNSSSTSSAGTHAHDFKGVDAASPGPGTTTMVTSPFGTMTQTTLTAGAHTHTVAVSGTTGAASNGNAGTTGVSPTNQNLPPYQTFNFIIKAL